MNRQRYMIVEYAHATHLLHRQDPFDKDGNFVNHLPVHHLLGTYHWSRLDDNHVMVLGHYPLPHHEHLQNHPGVSLLPSLSSSKKLKHAAKKDIHWHALRDNLGVHDESTMDDIIDELENRHGQVFGPLR